MIYIKRYIEDKIIENLSSGKVILIYGARRVGKTMMLQNILKNIDEEYILLNGEDMQHASLLENRSTANYKRLMGSKKLLVIDEAQAIVDIGRKLKLMIDTIPGMKIIATGSSSFDLINITGEPLVGRKKEYILFPLAQLEFSQIEDYITTVSNLEKRLIYGSYPELEHLKSDDERKEYLKEIVNSYLLKDIIAFEGIRKRDKIMQLLKIVSYRIGTELSLEGIGNQLQISKNTVERYLDLLSKVFVIFRVTGLKRNLDNEINKKSRWYFFDNGIRNAIIGNFNLLKDRDDTGKLWENYFIYERYKYLKYHNIHFNYYFWRYRNTQEIDWVEEVNNQLYGFEIKWGKKKTYKVPSAWKRAYPSAGFIVITPDNYLDYIV